MNLSMLDPSFASIWLVFLYRPEMLWPDMSKCYNHRKPIVATATLPTDYNTLEIIQPPLVWSKQTNAYKLLHTNSLRA
jgi:hypothetical protein